MFLGRKNQYCENDYTTKCNLRIQCDLYQITKGIFHRSRTKKFHKSYGNTKDPDAGRDWGQEEKGTTEDEMAGWHH